VNTSTISHWIGDGLWTSRDAIFGGPNIEFDSTLGENVFIFNSNDHLRRTIPASLSVVIGFIIGFKNSNSATANIIWSFTNASGVLMNLFLDTDGTIRLRRGTTVLGSSTTKVSPSTRIYVELSITFHASTGAFELRVAGNAEASGSGLNTTNVALGSGATEISASWVNTSGQTVVYMSRMYFKDPATSPEFFDPVTPIWDGPDSDDTPTDWDRTGAGLSADFEAIDENPPDGNTTFLSTTGAAVVTRHGFPASVSSAVIPRMVSLIGVAQNPDSGTIGLSLNVDSNATVTTRGKLNIQGGSYGGVGEHFILDPDGDVAWVPAQVNAVIAEVESQS
jgi:hypothetical protein